MTSTIAKPKIQIKSPGAHANQHQHGKHLSDFSPNPSSSKLLSPTQIFEESTHDVIILSPELDAAISKLLGSEKATGLQSSSNGNANNSDEQAEQVVVEAAAVSNEPGAAVTAQLNELFPTEESISGSEKVLIGLKLQISELDSQLRAAVKRNPQDRDTKEVILQIKDEIKDLIGSVQIIKEKANECENTVLEITKDIKSLDETKKNLSETMNLLKRMHVTYSSLEYIKGLANRKQYGQIADILRVLLKISKPLKEYKDNPQIVVLLDRLMAFQVDIKKAIFQEFEGAFNGGTISMQAATLYESCFVIELLEMDAKNALCRWYTEIQLQDYRNLFRKNPEVAGLADISRRFAWMKRMLKTFDENHAQIFPEHWEMAETLSWQFCQETKRDLAEVIIKSERDGSFETRNMLAAIQTTVEFEEKLEFRFVLKGRDIADVPKEQIDKFKKIMSSVYDSFLWHYIDMEDGVMTEKFDGFKRNLGEIEDGVYSSSFELFLFYRQTFANCAKLSTGKPFLDLCKMYQKWLDRYKDLLLSKLPKDERRVPTEEDLIQICTIITTSDYCGVTTGQLEEKLADTINREFTTLVSFQTEIENFTSTTGSTLIVLVRAVENALDGSLIAMTRKNWGTIASVGDQSDHISVIAQSLSAMIPIIRKQLTSPKFFRSFCDKFVESFLSKFLNTIYTRCKPLCEIGGEQMLLDTHSLNNILVAMTMLGAEEKSQPPSSFMKILAKGISKIDQLLKVVLRPHDPPDAIVETYILLFASDLSVGGFQKILELKGLRRNEISAILDMYNKKTHDSTGGGAAVAGITIVPLKTSVERNVSPIKITTSSATTTSNTTSTPSASTNSNAGPATAGPVKFKTPWFKQT